MKIGIQHFDKVTIMGRRTIEKLVLYCTNIVGVGRGGMLSKAESTEQYSP